MLIEKLAIEELRGVRSLELDFTRGGHPRRQVLLLGPNGAGKTTVLDAIAHVFRRLFKHVELGGEPLRASDVRNVDEKLAKQSFEIRAEFALSAPETQRVVAGGGPAASRLFVAMGLGGHTVAWLPPGLAQPQAPARVSDLLSSEDPPPGVLLPSDRGVLRSIDPKGSVPVSIFRQQVQAGSLETGASRFEALSFRLAMGFDAGEKDPALARMWKALGKYVPFFPVPVGTDGTGLRFRTRTGSVVRLDALSSGERATLLIFAELARRGLRNGVVLIDEIEQHLHPRWQREVMAGLGAMLPEAQFVVTSHSPYLAASMQDDVIRIGNWEVEGV